MSQLIINNQNKKSSSLLSPIDVRRATSSSGTDKVRAKVITIQKDPIRKARNSSSTLLLSPSLKTNTPNGDVVLSSSVSAISLLSMAEQQSVEVTQITSASLGSGRKIFRTMPSFKIMSFQNIVALFTVLICGLVTVNGLKCYMCGQYNEGVGSITPCLNYSEQYAHLYLKECSKKSEKYCVKYVSELSIVRDCATECAEKEIWETQTYCCTEDGCNGSSVVKASAVVLLPLVIYIVNGIMNIIKQRRR